MGAPSALARGSVKSNAELINGLRANMRDHKQEAAAAAAADDSSPSPSPTPTTPAPPLPTWTARSPTDPTSLLLPAPTPSPGLSEDRPDYDITVKLFYLPSVPPSHRCAHTRDALSLVLRELGAPSVDLLIVSFPGITFDADDESSSGDDSPSLASSPSPTSFSGPDSGGGGGGGGGSGGEAEDLDSIMRTWRTLEALQRAGLVARLGLAEFGAPRLAGVLARAAVRPSVDQISLRDCCVVPRPLILFARREGVELLTHSDCTDILPRRTLEELLAEEVDGGVGALAALDGAAAEGKGAEVVPLWVVKYTAVVKNRGVVENKGYFAAADLQKV
jgi:glutamate--cysteine ligase regulatory subunit